MSTGMNAYVGFSEESPYGTYVAPTNFLPANTSNMKYSREVLESKAVIAGIFVRDISQLCDGNVAASGRISYPLYRGDTLRILLEHCLGVETGNGSVATPYLYSPSSLKGKGLSIVVGKPSTDGTVHVHAYTGCKITSWSIGVQAGGVATLDIDFVAQDLDTGQSAPSITSVYPTMYCANHLGLTVDAGARSIASLTLSGDNALDTNRRFAGADTISEPLTIGDRVYMIEPNVEFIDDTDVDIFTAGLTAQAIVATFSAGDDRLRFNGNGVLMDGADPDISGKGRLEQNLKFKAVSALPSLLLSASAFSISQWDNSVPT